MTPLGIKRTCPQCAAKFYDLNKRPASCPKCTHTYDPSIQMRARRTRRAAPEIASAKQDVLLAHMAKAKAKPVVKPKKADDDVEIGPIEDIGVVAEEGIDGIEGIEGIEAIEEGGEEGLEGEIAIEEEGAVLIDTVSEETEEGFEEEEKPKKSKAATKRK